MTVRAGRGVPAAGGPGVPPSGVARGAVLTVIGWVGCKSVPLPGLPTAAVVTGVTVRGLVAVMRHLNSPSR